MTVKIAIEVIDKLIESHSKLAENLREKTKDWSDSPGDMGRTIAGVHEDIVKVLLFIKKNIQPNCKHPKKMQDGKKGQRYCMKCNMDLD